MGKRWLGHRSQWLQETPSTEAESQDKLADLDVNPASSSVYLRDFGQAIYLLLAHAFTMP